MNKKAYLAPSCCAMAIDATPILAGSPPAIKGESEDGPDLNDGGSTDDEKNKGIIFQPW